MRDEEIFPEGRPSEYSNSFKAPYIEGDFYVSSKEAGEFMEKFLSMKHFSSYSCWDTATWDEHKGNVHHFDVEIGEDVSHATRTKFSRRVREFINTELQLILHGY